MFLSQSALQNILGRHGNPWQAASPWQVSAINISASNSTLEWLLGNLKTNGSHRRATGIAAPRCRHWACSLVSLWGSSSPSCVTQSRQAVTEQGGNDCSLHTSAKDISQPQPAGTEGNLQTHTGKLQGQRGMHLTMQWGLNCSRRYLRSSAPPLPQGCLLFAHRCVGEQ